MSTIFAVILLLSSSLQPTLAENVVEPNLIVKSAGRASEEIKKSIVLIQYQLRRLQTYLNILDLSEPVVMDAIETTNEVRDKVMEIASNTIKIVHDQFSAANVKKSTCEVKQSPATC